MEVVVEDKLPTQSNLAASLTKKVIRRVDSSKLFPGLEDHLSDNKTHREDLVRRIVNRYFLFRIRSYTRRYNASHIKYKLSSRNKSEKNLQFMGM